MLLSDPSALPCPASLLLGDLGEPPLLPPLPLPLLLLLGSLEDKGGSCNNLPTVIEKKRTMKEGSLNLRMLRKFARYKRPDVNPATPAMTDL